MIGHVEWVEFARVPHVPEPDEIVHAEAVWSEPAGGGAVVASQLAKLAGGCDLFTVLGRDALGRDAKRYLERLDLNVHVRWTATSRTRRAWVHVDSDGERAITVLGDKLLPDAPEGIDAYDLVFFVSGTVEALRAARLAPFLAATLRESATLGAAMVPLDLVVGSASDPRERYQAALGARTVVMTEGEAGGTADGNRYAPAALTGPVVDSYGAGDSFAAALAFGLARGDSLAGALDLAARAGAAVLTGRGPYSSQLTGRGGSGADEL